jgi:Cu+-exporting ATPase
MVGTGRGAQLGILIKGPEVLESTRRVDTVVLDKTGTVTTGRMTLLDVVVDAGEDRSQVLRLAGALEDASEHPVAQAIAKGATEAVGTLPAVEGFTNVEGLGVHGVVEGHAVLVGRIRLLEDWSVRLSPELEGAKAAAEAEGRTPVVVGWDGAARGVLVVADAIKETSAEAIGQLRDLGLTPVLLTGDNATVARSVAAQVGIDDVMQQLLSSLRGPRRTPCWPASRRPDATRPSRDDGSSRTPARHSCASRRPAMSLSAGADLTYWAPGAVL